MFRRPVGPWLAGLSCLAGIYWATTYFDAEPPIDPTSVRAAARAAGLDSLAMVTVPGPGDLFEFVRNTPDGRIALRQLGKALFWDMQVGSDGQACASCHFHAGADNRTRNQLNPGINSGDRKFGNVGAGLPVRAGHPSFGPAYELKPTDFPLHAVDLCGPTDFARRTVLRDTNDVVSSEGVLSADFSALVPGNAAESGTRKMDPIFNVGGANMRQSAARNAPSVINAVFNVDNFWDGRAKSDFNGSSSLGPLDSDAGVFEDDATGTTLVKRKIRIERASLASQAVGPPLSGTEMSFSGRTFAQLGRKMLSLRPLDLQLVSPQDSVLGSLARGTLSGNRVTGQTGLNSAYGTLVRRAFQSRWWGSALRTDGFTQMEANFALYFGLAIQAYESLLVSDRSAFDRFMGGEDVALDQEQLKGLLAFIKTPSSRGKTYRAPFSVRDIFSGIGMGRCAICHAGPEFTAAAYTTTNKRGSIALVTTAELAGGKLAEQHAVWANMDQGFANIGVRPSDEDIGRGARIGQPLSFARAAVAGLPFAPPLPACGKAVPFPCPIGNRDLVDGAFKIPGLRNVELTGPYFHNGGQATLTQVLEFYRRQGDFGDLNVANVSPFLASVDLSPVDGDRIVKFLLGLTDERVRYEQAPFDHPQLFVPNGRHGGSLAIACSGGFSTCDGREEIPAIGAGGRAAAGLAPLKPFLQLDPQSNLRAESCPQANGTTR